MVGEIVPWLIAMSVLVLCSGFFSAGEAALFYLSERDRRELEVGSHSEQVVAQLLKNPERILSAVLFWNLVINITYFAMASVISIRLQEHELGGESYAVGFSVVALMTIIFCSEMLPKSVAVLNARAIAILSALPLALAVRLIQPLLPLTAMVNLISRRLL